MTKQCSWIIVGIFISSLTLSGYTKASENTPSKVTGSGIELFERAHSFSGVILDTPVFGVFEENPFGAKVEIRKNSKTLTLTLTETQTKYSGNIIEARTDEDSTEIKDKITHIEFVKIKKIGDLEGQITLNIDGETIQVKVIGKSFDHGHFQAPQFEATFRGKVVAFGFSGEACFGYSTNLAMMIFGSYVHLSK